ncbi:hypothetical protein DINM_022843 [Dirofilaria immitis]|nr:hypothetical protein [Dirofilaria immitis]
MEKYAKNDINNNQRITKPWNLSFCNKDRCPTDTFYRNLHSKLEDTSELLVRHSKNTILYMNYLAASCRVSDLKQITSLDDTNRLSRGLTRLGCGREYLTWIVFGLVETSLLRFHWMPQSGVLINGFIAVDKFPKDATIEYYFLTHAHSDHYGAVDNKWNNGTIYCSPITARILPVVTHRPRSKRIGIRSHLIHALDLNVWHRMNGFSVMLLDANHIPGSVMFLFEGDRIPDGRILFTGDFRADIRLYQNAFMISALQERNLSRIYLDTTYINCAREEFPSQEASSSEICILLRELLFANSKPVTIMIPKVGREQLLVDIAIEFRCKIWVDYIRFRVVEILGLNEYFTVEKTETSIWTCTRQNIRSVLYDTDARIIEISMLRHIKSSSVIKDGRIRYIEYSDHSSPNEIRDFLSQLSFTQLMGLSVQLSEKQTEELERLSLTGFNNVLIRIETNESTSENELSALISPTIRSRIGLAYDHALRSAFDIGILQRTINNDQKLGLGSIDKSQLEIDEGNANVSSDEMKAIDNENVYTFNLIMKKIAQAVNVENLATRFCMELNNNESIEENNLLYKFLNEMDISKEMETLDSFGEKYHEAVNAVAKMQIAHDINLPYNAQEHAVYDTSRGPASVDIPLEWLNESVERLFLRLALINDDSKLEAFIRKHLLDIIHCTSTGEVEVRNKGMELLTHLNLRVKNNLTIALPLKDILHYLLSLAEGNILATNFAIIYLKIALDRVDTNEHITLLPSLLDAASRNMAVMLNNFPDHPCMSRNGFLRIAKDVIVDLKVNIISLKLSIIKVLSSIFTEAEILPLLIGATANGPSEVEIAGDVAIKKIDLQKVLRNKDTVNSLFNLYLGLSLQKLDEGDKVLPATVPIKLKLMPLLMKSLVGIQTFPNNIKFSSVVAVAYQCFGIIGSKVPQLVLNDMALLQETFDAIPLAPEEVSFAIADCLVSWLPVFCTVNDVALIGVLETIISSYIVHSPKCRLVALKFVETLVKTSSLEFRWILCQACEDPRDEMKHEAVRLLDLSIADPTMTPKFEDLVAFMHRKLNLQDASGETANFSTAEAKKKKEFADEVFYISSFYLYANLQVACSLQPLSLAEADVFSRTSDYPIAAWLERHLNSNSRITVCAKLSQLYSLILNDIERKKCLKRCIEQFDDRNELPLQIPWLCVYLATQPAVDLIAEEINEIKIRLLNIIETLSVQQYFEAACGSLAELLRRAVFGLSEVEKFFTLVFVSQTVLVSSVSDNQFCSFCELLGRIAASRKDILTSKMKESAVRCLGFLSLHNLPSTLYEKILAQLFACGEIATQPEFQFIVGNALFDAAFSESSPSRRNMFTETEECFIETNLSVAKRDNIEKRVANLLEILLTVKLHHTNRHLRQAAFIWLFTLVKRCAITKLNCIMNNLSSIQHAFISGLAETNESSQQLASEGLGIIFELSSEEQKKRMVEELISTLSVGRKRVDPVSPDTRLFGKGELGNTPSGIIIQQAESAVKPYLAQLVPKLYRYRYDPDLKVQSAMRSIWQAVTVSKKSVVRFLIKATEEYADAIFNELILTLTDSQWRMRESSCLALADLLSGYCTDKIVERFGQLFEILYRVQDDVKDSVRVAAGRALSSLIKITVHKCSSVNGAKATRLLGTVLPVIAEKGIGSSVKINKILSLKIIMDIVKEAGLALQEHINIIIPCLLDSLSEEESTFLNYLAARSSLDELEVLDSARMSVAHSSPMMSTLRYIVPYVNENIFNFLGDKLMEQLRSSIGVTTRTGTCQFIIDLCLQRQQLLMSCRSSCDRMVRVLLNGLSDPNPVIKKQFSSLLHLLRALSRNTELLSESLSVVVPFIFLYKCQEDTSSAMRLYCNEMIELALVTLNTSSVFSIKAQAAKVLEIISGSGVISDDVDYAEILYDNLTNALRGRIWNGKEKLIEAISALLRSAGKNLVLKWDEITVEAKYSGEAILCAAVFCEMTACNKIAEQVMSYICDVMNYNHSKSNFDDTTSETSNTNHSKTCDYLTKIAPAISHLLLSFDGAELFDRIKQTVTLLKSNIFWKVKQALVIELPYFIERCTTQVDFTALFVVIGSLLTENDISQRRTFAQQCCGVLEYVVKRAQKKECILALHNHKDMVEILKKTTIVKSSALLDDLLKWEM